MNGSHPSVFFYNALIQSYIILFVVKKFINLIQNSKRIFMRLKYDIHKCFKCSQTRLKNDFAIMEKFACCLIGHVL